MSEISSAIRDVTITSSDYVPFVRNGETKLTTLTRFIAVANAAYRLAAYTPTTGADWDGPPATVQAALDELAARVTALENA